MSEAEYFSTDSGLEQSVYNAVFGHLAGVGPLTVEFVSVGIFFKRVRTFAELRPKRDRRRQLRVELSVMLSRVLPPHPRIVRTWRGPGRSAYFIDLRSASEVDEEIRDWLIEAYAASPD